jgi:uncharacterized protein YifN (PemK superfamily)
MSESAPTTDQIRRLYAYTMAGDRIHRTGEYSAQFDRWLAAHVERVRTEERERCRKIAEAESALHGLYLHHVTSDTRWEQGAIAAADRIAAAIRAVSAEQEDHHG